MFLVAFTIMIFFYSEVEKEQSFYQKSIANTCTTIREKVFKLGQAAGSAFTKQFCCISCYFGPGSTQENFPWQVFDQSHSQSPCYPCLAAEWRCDSHACRSKTSISRPLTPMDQFLMPG